MARQLPRREWITHTGTRRPATGGRDILARIRCQSRTDALRREPQPPSYWKRWSQDGGAGDIVEYWIT